MKHFAVAALGVGLLLALYVLRSPSQTQLHGVLAVLAFAAAWTLDRQVARGLGRPARWLVVTAILIAFGAWLGTHDARWHGAGFSRSGALAGVTMASRAIGLLLVTSALSRSVAPARMLTWLGGTRAQPLAASVVVALRLAPELAEAVRIKAREAKQRAPGLLRAPSRWFDVLVAMVAHAASLSDEVSAELDARVAAAEEERS